jgi:aspartyl-tRNA(Asn)/glutamyl-tRNA(Gln) amidotransferase subunit A
MLATITELSSALHQGKISSYELTEYYLKRIERFDSHINSFITIAKDSALTAAKAADAQLASGQAGPLTGIPIAQKDIFCTAGLRTTCASLMLHNFIAPYDATVVSNLKRAGTVLLGKTNMDEFAMGSSNENSYFGVVHNPWGQGLVPGGSSGGSAAAVAANFIPGATGSDSGGSIRQPAALCGLTGLKPTYGRVSRYGMIAFASSLDQAGTLTKTAADAALLLTAMAGFDPNDATTAKIAVPDYSATLNESIKGIRIGLPKEYFTDLTAAMAANINTVIKEYESLGVEFIEISLPHTKLSIPAYYTIAPAECSSNLARYDGVRYGYRCQEPKNLADLYQRTRSEGFGAEVKRRIMLGTFMLAAESYEAYYLKAQQVRQLIRHDFINAFQTVDALLCPTTPAPAFQLGAKSKDPISMYLSDIFTISVNLAGLPALSMPSGFINELPVGVQLIGNYFNEGLILNLAHLYQQINSWHTIMPSLNQLEK